MRPPRGTAYNAEAHICVRSTALVDLQRAFEQGVDVVEGGRKLGIECLDSASRGRRDPLLGGRRPDRRPDANGTGKTETDAGDEHDPEDRFS